MDCRKVREVVFVYADNEMEGELLVSFRKHVAVCPECARRTIYAERLITVVRKRCVKAVAPEQLRQRILSGLRHYQAGD
ncbi:MAG: mycothiol system anti-sigma-R factor [bacterium]|nr:mycothiol system anti-sigma-R factor [bacterium]